MLKAADGSRQLLPNLAKLNFERCQICENMGNDHFFDSLQLQHCPKEQYQMLSYFTIVGISHHHQHSCPCLGADLGLREMFVIKSVRYSSALERTLPSPLTSSIDEEAVADGDNYDIADDEEYYANAGADVFD